MPKPSPWDRAKDIPSPGSIYEEDFPPGVGLSDEELRRRQAALYSPTAKIAQFEKLLDLLSEIFGKTTTQVSHLLMERNIRSWAKFISYIEHT